MHRAGFPHQPWFSPQLWVDLLLKGRNEQRCNNAAQSRAVEVCAARVVNTPGGYAMLVHQSPDAPTEIVPETTAPAERDIKGAALTVLAVAAAILLAKYMQSVLIPFVLAGLVFYALDPVVDRLERLRVPRSLGAAIVIALVVGAAAVTTYSLLDDALRVIEELPAAAQKVRARWAANVNETPTAIDKMQEAARAIEETAAAASPPNPSPRGVARVRVEEPGFRASDYVWWSSVGALALLGQAS